MFWWVPLMQRSADHSGVDSIRRHGTITTPKPAATTNIRAKRLCKRAVKAVERTTGCALDVRHSW
jgi:hypothetical protein